MIDWVLSIDPRNISTICDKYETIARYGKSADVEIVVINGRCDSCANCAAVVAANIALRRRDRAVEAARIGFNLARREDRSKAWLRQFGTVLQGIGRYAVVG